MTKNLKDTAKIKDANEMKVGDWHPVSDMKSKNDDIKKYGFKAFFSLSQNLDC